MGDIFAIFNEVDCVVPFSYFNPFISYAPVKGRLGLALDLSPNVFCQLRPLLPHKKAVFGFSAKSRSPDFV